MIGKIISEKIGLTKSLSGTKNQIIDLHAEVDDKEILKLQSTISSLNRDEIKIRAAVDESPLGNIDKLSDYAVKQSQNGRAMDLDQVKSLIQNQAIADQAHGFSGVNAAIKEYNKLTDESSKKDFAQTISKSNPSLGKYLEGLKDANGGILDYCKSLAIATLKTVGLTIATTAMNAAVNFGVSVAMSAIGTAIDNYIHRVENVNETIDNIRSEYENSKSEIESTNAELEETNQKISELESKGTLSFTDEAELDKLKQQNDELERALMFQEKKKENEAKQVVGEISKNKEDLFDDFEDATTKYSNYKKGYEEHDKIGIEGVKNGDIDVEDYEEIMNSMGIVLSDYEGELLERIETFEKYKDDIVNKYGSDDTSQYSLSDKQLYNDIVEKLQEAYRAVYSDSEYNKVIIEPIFKTDAFDGLYDQMLKFFVSGGSTDLSTLEDKFGKDVITSLRNACEKSGVDFDKMIADMYANSQRKLDQIAPVFERPNSSSEAEQNTISHSIRDFIENGLSEEDRTILLYADIPEEQKFKTIQDVKDFINSLKEKAGDETTTSTPKTFKETWDSIGTTGDEKDDKAALETKEKLLELAEAGKLTEEAFSDSSIATQFMKDTGLSAEEATQKVNELISSADQLASMKTGISSISSILGEKKAGNDIGADTLAGMPNDIKNQTKEYEHFVEVLSDGTSTMDECKTAANKLATAYVNSSNFLANLTDDNKKYYISVLDEMGVENAAQVVTNALAVSKERESLASEHQNEISWKTVEGLYNETDASDATRFALVDLALEKEGLNRLTLDTADDINSLIKLGEQAGITASELATLRTYESMMSKGYGTSTDLARAKKEAEKVGNSVLESFKNKTKVGTSVKPSKSSGSKGFGSKSKSDKSKSTQQFDWISRALDRLSTKLDLVKTKYDNLFNSKKAKNSDSLLKLQNKNLEKQYKLLVKTEKYQDKAAKKYSKKASNVKISGNKKEDASLKKAVREGRISGSMKQLIATYGEKKAEKIQKYQDWYDKSQEAKKNKISTQQAKRENRIQKYQNLADNADNKKALTQAQKENAKTAQEKNEQINDEIEYLSTSYDYQIKIAKLEKDSLKVKQLQAEKAKELRDLQIEQHQNLADEYQSTLDRYSAEKELATKVSDKNNLIEQEKATTQALYAEKIAIAGLEGNTAEMLQLQAELEKELRDLQIEQHQNLAANYQAELDMLSAQKDNRSTADDKNRLIDSEKNTTIQLYNEKIAIAELEGNVYEKQKLQEELSRQLIVLEKEKLDNIAAYYENLRKITELQRKNLSNAVDELEARGLIVTSKLYSSQIAQNNEIKKNREEELMLLEKQHDKIDKGTQAWYDSLDTIQACKDSISECTLNTIELDKAIRNIGWQLFDKLSTRIDLLVSEYDLAIKLMSNKKLINEDNGNFTEEGTATLGAYYSQLVLTQEKAKSMWSTLENMKRSIDNGDEGYTDQNALDEYCEKRQEYIRLLENEYDLQQNLIELMKDKYQSELDYLKDIIDRRKELLQAEKDEYNYRRTIEEKTKNIGVLAKQVSALSGDDSEAAKAKIQQLKANLDEAKKDLQDTEYDRWVSDQQKMLDNLYNEYSDFIDDKLNDVDALLQEAIAYLSKIDISSILDEYYAKYKYDPTDDFKNINTALGKDGSIVTAIGNAATTITDYLKQQHSYQKMADDVEEKISEIGNVYSDVSAIERFKKAKESYDKLSTAGDDGENIQNHVSSSSISTLNTAGKEVQEIKNSVTNTKSAIDDIGNLDNISGFNEENNHKIQCAYTWYNNLSTSGKQLLGDYYKNLLDYKQLQYNHWAGVATDAARRAQEEQNALKEQQKADAQNSFARMVKETYWQDLNFGTSTLNGNGATDYGQVQQRIFNRGLKRDDKPYVNANWIKEACKRLGYPEPAWSAGTLLNYMNNIGFSHGGIAETLQKIPGMNGDDGWITVKRGEAVLTPEQTKAFHTLADNLSILNPSVDLLAAISKPPAASFPKNGHSSTQIEGVDFHFELPNVVDSDSFIREMQTNPKVEKVIKTMLWNKDSLSKYRI